MGLKAFFARFGLLTDGNVTASKVIADWSGEPGIRAYVDGVLYEGAVAPWHFGSQTNSTMLASSSLLGRPLPAFVDIATTISTPVQTIYSTTAPRVTIPTGAIGYATGAGSAVTQLTSRTTGVTLNTPTGIITLFSAAGSAAWQTFTVTNSLINQQDGVLLTTNFGANTYLYAAKTVAGGFNISVSAVVGTATEAPTVNFQIIKGANS